MFIDEGASIYSAHLGWEALARQSRHVDLVLLPYYVLLHGWLAFSDSIEWARALSVIAFGLTSYFVGLIGLSAAGRWCGFTAAIITVTNPLLLANADSARPYTLCALATTVCVMALLNWLKSHHAKWIWLYSAAGLVAALFQLFSLLATVSVLVVAVTVYPGLLRNSDRKLAVPLGVFVVAAAIFAVPATEQRGQVDWIRRVGVHNLGVLLGPSSGAGGKYALLIAFIIVFCALTCLLSGRRGELVAADNEWRILAIGITWAAVPRAILLVASEVKPIFVNRYVAECVPGLALVVGLFVSKAFGVFERRWSSVSLVALRSVVAVVSVLCIVTFSFKTDSVAGEDLKGASGYIAVHYLYGQAIALPDHSLTGAVGYYLASHDRTFMLWPQLKNQVYIEGLDLRAGVSAQKVAPKGVWLVDDGSVKGLTEFKTMLALSGYSKVSNTMFNGVIVRFFQLSS
jgi:mannosyltransferase